MKQQDNENKTDISKNVIFLGNRNDVYRLYNAMDVFILPSRYEGLPVVGVEAQANGLPCVLSDKMTTETKMTDTAEFMSIEQDINEWAEKILASQPNNRSNTFSKLTGCGFNIENEAGKLEELYLSAAQL